jgi:hypothetical protein
VAVWVRQALVRELSFFEQVRILPADTGALLDDCDRGSSSLLALFLRVTM